MVHKPSPCPPVMWAAPWRIFHHKDQEIIIDVDGGISLDGNVSNPFPAEITFATICDNGLAATWVDHDLRLARMAFIPLDETLQEGVSKAKLRTHRETTMVAGSKWCHIIDAEPLALESKDDKIIFALWARGIYCIDSSANEIWRTSLFTEEEKSPPRSNEVTSISINEDEIFVWSRGGAFRKIALSDGQLISQGSLGVPCDVERVFNCGEIFLITSKDGWVWEFRNQEITVARKLRGTVQDAVFDGDDWRIISWRDDVMLRGDSQKREDLGVQLFENNEEWLVLDNQGLRSPHMLSEK